MYENEREKLISDFYREAYKRDALTDSRKIYFENYVHAATSLTKSRIEESSENFLERRVEVESETFVKREDLGNKAAKRESLACFEIRNLVNFFNKELWPNTRMKNYQDTLLKQIEADKVIEKITKKFVKAEKEIENLNEELQTLTRQQLVKETNLKSEIKFMTKLMQSGKKKIKTEESKDFEKIKHLAKVCDKVKKLLKEKIDKGKKVEAMMKVCTKFEKLSDKIEISEKLDASFEKLDESLEMFEESFGQLVNPESSDDLASFENIYRSSKSCATNFTELFFKKISKVEAEVLMLRRYKEEQTKQGDKMKIAIKNFNHELGVQQNLQMLRLNTTPSVGEIYQVANQIPQIITPVKLQKKFKLCKNCRDFYGNL